MGINLEPGPRPFQKSQSRTVQKNSGTGWADILRYALEIKVSKIKVSKIKVEKIKVAKINVLEDKSCKDKS